MIENEKRNGKQPPAAPKNKANSERSGRYVVGTPAKKASNGSNRRVPLKIDTESALVTAKEIKRNENIVRVKSSPDRILIMLILLLLCIGSVMVFSASYPEALSDKKDSLYYIKRQLVFIGMGMVLMIGAACIPYTFFKRVTRGVYGFTIFLLVLVLVIGIAEGEAQRWLSIPGLPFTVQPSEIAKLTLVLMLAWYMDKYKDKMNAKQSRSLSMLYNVLIPGAFIAVVCGLVLLEKHLSGTMIIVMIGMIVVFIGSSKPIVAMVTYVAAGIAGAAAFVMANPYAMKRVTTFFSENVDAQGADWQTTQGLLAIGSGGFLGVGLGNSRQKYSYVSQPQNDFIFTIWCEEMGFVGAVFIIALFLIFVWRGYLIAMRAPDTFSSITAFGITSKIAIQVMLNIAVVTDLIPNTGVALPFFSYGGSFLLILMLEMGVLLSISRHSYQKK